MLRRYIPCIAVLALFMGPVAMAQVGQVAKLTATLSVGYYIQIKDNGPIKVEPDYQSADPMHTLAGCLATKVESNFETLLRGFAQASSPAKGLWKVDISPHLIPNGVTDIQICVRGTNVQTQNLKGGQSEVPVAEIRIQFMPK